MVPGEPGAVLDAQLRPIREGMVVPTRGGFYTSGDGTTSWSRGFGEEPAWTVPATLLAPVDGGFLAGVAGAVVMYR